MRHSFLFTSALVVLIPALAHSAPQPTGKTVGVSPAAYANGEVGYRVLGLEQGIYMGDRVETGAAGEAQLLFNDNTRLVVGPSSALQIDSYVVREDNKLRSFALTALRGAYRFSTGNGPKQAYNIRTPAMTLGIRGTKFDFVVAQDGSTDFVLLEGSARVCDRGGNCMVASDPCTFISIPSYAPMRRVSGLERSIKLRERFPYVVSQRSRLRQDFQFNVSSCGNIIQTGNPNERTSDQAAAGPAGPSGGGGGSFGGGGGGGGGSISGGNNGFGNGGRDGSPGNSNKGDGDR